MHIEAFREFCLSLSGTTEDFPFDENTLVFKVGGKIYALTDVDLFESVNLKCEPEKAVELREKYEGVLPGYHMNKKHWNTVLFDGSVSDQLLREWTKNSYDLVVAVYLKRCGKVCNRSQFISLIILLPFLYIYLLLCCIFTAQAGLAVI